MMPVTMLGRAGELDELAGSWSRLAAGAGGPRTAIVGGPAGAGKSRLVAAALEAFDPAPATVLYGRARVHSPAPYDWLAAVLSAHTSGELPVPAGALAWLAQRPDAAGARYAPSALLRLAVTTVRTLVGRGPAVIVVEDLHALDPASLNLVAELAAAPGLPALLLVTSRPPGESASARLTARTLARLAGTPGAVRQHLGPLTAPDVAELLAQVAGAPVTPEQAAAAHRHTGGNPYRLTELLAAAPAPTSTGDGVALKAAADHLAAGLPETALRAVEVGLPAAADPQPLLRLGVAAALAAGRDAEAAGYAARRLALLPATPTPDLAAAHRELATAHGRLGQETERAAALTRARETLKAAGPVEAAEWARFWAAQAEADLDAGRLAEARHHARQARELADPATDPMTLAAAGITLAAVLAAGGELEPGLALLRTARRAAAERRDLALLGRAVACMLDRYLPRLDPGPAWFAFDEAVATTTRYGVERQTGRSILAGVRLAIRLGDAARAGELVSARLPLEPEPELRARLAAAAGLLTLDTAPEKAALLVEVASEAAAESGRPPALAAAALLRVALGAPLAGYPETVPGADPSLLVEAARWALLANADPAEVRAVLAAAAVPVPTGREALQLECALLAAEGTDAAAVEAGVAALDGPTVAAWMDADTHLTIARCQLRLGHPTEARQHAERARDLLAAWPGRLAERAAEILASLTVAAELTARELEVLGCLAAGMSNKQIARSLGISVRTVTVHVSNLLRKTGTASRTEAALWAVHNRPVQATAG